MRSKEYLMRALKEMPESLHEAKAHIKRAIAAMDNTEVKEQGGPAHLALWQSDLQSGLINPLTHKLTVQSIDTMISMEKQKLESIKKQSIKKQNVSIDVSNAETLLD